VTQSILLDTNALLWILGNDPKLSKRVQAGKLSFDVPIERVLSEVFNAWPVLMVRPEHITEILELPPIHRDPFDRLLIAQARTEGMILATSDSQIRQYEVSTIW
jgi:PIN domain nuclease of toxin-antitoxin system